MFLIRVIAIFLFGISAAVCFAQRETVADPIASISANPAVDRRIEILIRSQFSVPPDYDISLGARVKSDIPDYDNLPVTLIHQGKQTVIDFLISKDCNTLARLQKFDIGKNPATMVDARNRPVRGDTAAKVEIVNFDDLECPFCARLNNELSQRTLNHYKGLIKIRYEDYPLDGHPWAMHAAVDGNCLADLNANAYWSYVDYVHSHGQDISGADFEPARSFLALDRIARAIGTQSNVDEAKLSICLKKQDGTLVNSSLKLGRSLGIEATPQMFVNGEQLPAGARPVEELWPAIDRALKAEGIQPPPSVSPITSPRADDGPLPAH